MHRPPIEDEGLTTKQFTKGQSTWVMAQIHSSLGTHDSPVYIFLVLHSTTLQLYIGKSTTTTHCIYTHTTLQQWCDHLCGLKSTARGKAKEGGISTVPLNMPPLFGCCMQYIYKRLPNRVSQLTLSLLFHLSYPVIWDTTPTLCFSFYYFGNFSHCARRLSTNPYSSDCKNFSFSSST